MQLKYVLIALLLSISAITNAQPTTGEELSKAFATRYWRDDVNKDIPIIVTHGSYTTTTITTIDQLSFYLNRRNDKDKRLATHTFRDSMQKYLVRREPLHIDTNFRFDNADFNFKLYYYLTFKSDEYLYDTYLDGFSFKDEQELTSADMHAVKLALYDRGITTQYACFAPITARVNYREGKIPRNGTQLSQALSIDLRANYVVPIKLKLGNDTVIGMVETYKLRDYYSKPDTDPTADTAFLSLLERCLLKREVLVANTTMLKKAAIDTNINLKLYNKLKYIGNQYLEDTYLDRSDGPIHDIKDADKLVKADANAIRLALYDRGYVRYEIEFMGWYFGRPELY